MKIIPGMKLFDYSIGTESILRVYKIVDKNKLYASEPNDRIIVIDHNNQKKKIRLKDIESYTLLKPKAISTFSIVEINNIADLIVTINTVDNNSLEIICRQSCVDIINSFSTNSDMAKSPSIGMSLTKKISKQLGLSKTMFEDYLKCDKFKSKHISYIYLDDTLTDIVKYSGAKRQLDKLMNDMYFYYDKEFKNTELINTASRSLYELLLNTSFMIDLHDTFDIIDIPFSIKNKESTPIDTLKDIITQVTNDIPKDIFVYPFDYKIGLNDIKMNHLLMMEDCTKYKNFDPTLYIVGYTIDTKTKYFSKKENVDNAFKKLGFK